MFNIRFYFKNLLQLKDCSVFFFKNVISFFFCKKTISFFKQYLIYIIYTYIFIILNLILFPITWKLTQFYLIAYITWIVLTLILFNYFQTIYKFSKWTSQIKFFWIRTFTIFWGLEFYLLSIFIFLFIISPDEFKYFFFITKTIFESIPNNVTVESYIMILLLLLVINLNVYSIIYRSLFIINIVIILFFIILLMILINEVNSYNTYASISNYKNNINKSIKTKLLSLSSSSVEYKIINNYCHSNSLTINNILKQRPSTIILNIILAVKFYHVYTIVIFTTFLLVVNTWSNKAQSVELCAFITQNLIILLLFYSLNYLIYYKFLYKYIIYGFYTNISLNYTTTAEMSYILEFFQNEFLFHFFL